VVEFLQSRGAAGAVKANVQRANNAFNFNEAAANGDLAELRRFVAAGAKVNEGDYDSRRAIHIAASEGQLEVVRFLVDEAGADHSVADRWGYTPLADANRAQQHAVADFLRMRGAEDREEEERQVVRSRGGAGLNSGLFKGSFLGEMNLDAPKTRKMPDPLVCPLSGARFNAPMVAADGYTYDHAAIEAWLDKRGPVSPTTGEEMESSALIPNRVVGALINRRAARSQKKAIKLTRSPECLANLVFFLAALVVLALGIAHIERTTRDEGRFASNSSLDGVVKHGVDGGFMYEGFDERRHAMEAAEAI